jgi:hypothetical protein
LLCVTHGSVLGTGYKEQKSVLHVTREGLFEDLCKRRAILSLITLGDSADLSVILARQYLASLHGILGDKGAEGLL